MPGPPLSCTSPHPRARRARASPGKGCARRRAGDGRTCHFNPDMGPTGQSEPVFRGSRRSSLTLGQPGAPGGGCCSLSRLWGWPTGSWSPESKGTQAASQSSGGGGRALAGPDVRPHHPLLAPSRPCAQAPRRGGGSLRPALWTGRFLWEKLCGQWRGERQWAPPLPRSLGPSQTQRPPSRAPRLAIPRKPPGLTGGGRPPGQAVHLAHGPGPSAAWSLGGCGAEVTTAAFPRLPTPSMLQALAGRPWLLCWRSKGKLSHGRARGMRARGRVHPCAHRGCGEAGKREGRRRPLRRPLFLLRSAAGPGAEEDWGAARKRASGRPRLCTPDAGGPHFEALPPCPRAATALASSRALSAGGGGKWAGRGERARTPQVLALFRHGTARGTLLWPPSDTDKGDPRDEPCPRAGRGRRGGKAVPAGGGRGWAESTAAARYSLGPGRPALSSGPQLPRPRARTRGPCRPQASGQRPTD